MSKESTEQSPQLQQSVQQALLKLVRNCHAISALPLAKSDGDAWINPDPELAHQARVALRRLRSSLKFLVKINVMRFDPAFDEQLRWLFHELGQARDWDVFIQDALPQFAAQFAAQFEAQLRQAAQRRQQAAYAILQSALASERYAQLQNTLNAMQGGDGIRRLWAQSADRPRQARRLLRRQHRQLQADIVHLRAGGAEQCHIIRIDVKKLRYTTEFAVPLVKGARGKRMRKYVKVLTQAQDSLGHLNDVAQAGRLLDKLLLELLAGDESFGPATDGRAQTTPIAGLRHAAAARFAAQSLLARRLVEPALDALAAWDKPWQK